MAVSMPAAIASERKVRFQNPFPEDGAATITFVTKTADVKIPYSVENIKLP